MTGRVYSYMRFSTPEQAKGHSLQRQTDYAIEYAQNNGLILDESLSLKDEGLSAYHQKHITKGALGTFYRGIEEGMVEPGSILIVENLDRLSRAKPLDALPHFLNIIRAGITVVIAKDGKTYSEASIDQSPFTLIESIIDMVRANQESEYKSDRVKKSIIGQIKYWLEHGKGRVIRNGKDPLWLKEKPDKSGFDVVPENLQVVLLIIQKFLHGWGYIKIIEYLKQHHKPFSGRTWHMSYLSHMLKSRCLIGERSFKVGDEQYFIPDYYPAILDEVKFHELQQCLAGRASTKSQQRIPSIVTGNGICFCGHCGNSLVAQNHKPRPSKKNPIGATAGLRRIGCVSRNSSEDCPQTAYNSGSIANTVSAVPIEKALFEYCSDQMELSAILNDDTDKSLGIKAQIGELKHQASEAETVVNNGNEAMTRLLMQGEDITAINRLVKEYQTKVDELQARIQTLEDELRFQKVHKSADLVAQWRQVKSDIYNMDEEARLLIRQIVKKTFKRIEIYFHSFGKSDTGKRFQLPIDDQYIVMILTFTNDKTRLLVIDRKSGDWVKGGDMTFSAEAVHSSLAARQTADA